MAVRLQKTCTREGDLAPGNSKYTLSCFILCIGRLGFTVLVPISSCAVWANIITAINAEIHLALDFENSSFKSCIAGVALRLICRHCLFPLNQLHSPPPVSRAQESHGEHHIEHHRCDQKDDHATAFFFASFARIFSAPALITPQTSPGEYRCSLR